MQTQLSGRCHLCRTQFCQMKPTYHQQTRTPAQSSLNSTVSIPKRQGSSTCQEQFAACVDDIAKMCSFHTKDLVWEQRLVCSVRILRYPGTQQRVKHSLPGLGGFSPHTFRSHHSPSSCAANQSKGRKLSWPAVSPRALMAIYGKNHCQRQSGLQARCWGHIRGRSWMR